MFTWGLDIFWGCIKKNWPEHRETAEALCLHGAVSGGMQYVLVCDAIEGFEVKSHKDPEPLTP